MLHFDNNSNILAFLLALSLFMMTVERKPFYSKGINYIAGLSLTVYVVHENILVRTYLRPLVWIWIKKNFGYSYVLLRDIIFATVLFVVSILISSLYKETLQRLIHKICDKLYEPLKLMCTRTIDKIISSQ